MSRSINLTAKSPIQTFAEPLDLDAEVKPVLNIEASFTDDDVLLGNLISTARVYMEEEEDIDLVRKQWDLTMDSFWDGWGSHSRPDNYGIAPSSGQFQSVIELRRPLVSVDLVQYKDSDGEVTTISQTTDYIVDLNAKPGVILPPWGKSWPFYMPWNKAGVLIRFTSGVSPTDAFWDDEGARIKTAMKVLIKELYVPQTFYETGNKEGIPYATRALTRTRPRVG